MFLFIPHFWIVAALQALIWSVEVHGVNVERTPIQFGSFSDELLTLSKQETVQPVHSHENDENVQDADFYDDFTISDDDQGDFEMTHDILVDERHDEALLEDQSSRTLSNQQDAEQESEREMNGYHEQPKVQDTPKEQKAAEKVVRDQKDLEKEFRRQIESSKSTSARFLASHKAKTKSKHKRKTVADPEPPNVIKSPQKNEVLATRVENPPPPTTWDHLIRMKKTLQLFVGGSGLLLAKKMHEAWCYTYLIMRGTCQLLWEQCVSTPMNWFEERQLQSKEKRVQEILQEKKALFWFDKNQAKFAMVVREANALSAKIAELRKELTVSTQIDGSSVITAPLQRAIRTLKPLMSKLSKDCLQLKGVYDFEELLRRKRFHHHHKMTKMLDAFEKYIRAELLVLYFGQTILASKDRPRIHYVLPTGQVVTDSVWIIFIPRIPIDWVGDAHDLKLAQRHLKQTYGL